MKSNESHPEKKQEATTMIIITAIIGIINVMILAGGCTPKTGNMCVWLYLLELSLSTPLGSHKPSKMQFFVMFFFSFQKSITSNVMIMR